MDFRIFEATPGISIILLPDAPVYTYVAVSDGFLKASGLKQEEVIGRSHFEVFPANPGDVNFSGEQNLRASFERVIRTKTTHEIPGQRYDIPQADGSFIYKHWKVVNVPLLNDDGSLAYILHSATDITEQETVKQQLDSTKGLEKAYHFFMNAPVIIGVLRGDDYVIELANEGLLEVWGRTAEVIGKPLLEALPEFKEQAFTSLLDEVRSSGKPFYAYEYPITVNRNNRQEVLYFDFVYKPIHEGDNEGKASGVISVGHDVTEQVLARKQLQQVTDALNFRNALFEAQNETTPDAVLIVDAKGKILLHNSRFIDIWQMPVEILERKDDDAALAHAMTMVVNPDQFIGQVKKLYNSRKERSQDQLQLKDGRTIERFGTSIIAENGLYYGWAWYFRDISELKRQQAAIEDQNVLIRTITDNATSTLFMMNDKGYCTFMNAAGERMFGYSQEEIRSRPLHYLIHHHRPDGSLYPMEECPLDRALPDNFDVRAHRDLFFRKDGTSFPVTCAASPIFENEVPIATVIEVRDITLELEAEQALQRSAAELEQIVDERTKELQLVNTRLQEFTYAASHDLQEPLRKIKFFREQLLSGIQPLMDDASRKVSQKIEATISRMQRLIDDLLDYANTSHGSSRSEIIDLNVLCREVLDDMEATILTEGALVDVGALPVINGDALQFRQLFQNLISNGLKYKQAERAPALGITSEVVSVKAGNTNFPAGAAGNTYHHLVFTDNGIGFSDEDAAKIFDLFHRLHGRAVYPGTGIGLSIVQKVADNHGCFVWANGTPGSGAAFHVLIPVK